jgi:hypothetical protein
MSLDQPASSDALWAIYDATGIRPEYLLPVIWAESGFQPNVQNYGGAPYYGLNQVSSNFLAAHGVSPDDYVTWPASRQLSDIVLPYMQGVVSRYGTPHSAIKVEQGNFYPASLATATSLSDAIVSAPSAAYEGNKGLDFESKGFISVGDLGTFLQRGMASSHGAVQSAIDAAYSGRLTESPQDPIYGTDFFTSANARLIKPLIISVSALFLGVLVANEIDPSVVPRPLRSLRV